MSAECSSLRNPVTKKVALTDSLRINCLMALVATGLGPSSKVSRSRPLDRRRSCHSINKRSATAMPYMQTSTSTTVAAIHAKLMMFGNKETPCRGKDVLEVNAMGGFQDWILSRPSLGEF